MPQNVLLISDVKRIKGIRELFYFTLKPRNEVVSAICSPAGRWEVRSEWLCGGAGPQSVEAGSRPPPSVPQPPVARPANKSKLSPVMQSEQPGTHVASPGASPPSPPGPDRPLHQHQRCYGR